MTKKIIIGLTIIGLISGCSTKNDELYYKAVQEQNHKYMEAYKTVENERVSFDGTFNGNITMIKPKKLPQLAHIQKAKSASELALDWARVIVPGATMVAGMHYNYKAMDSNNKYNSETMTGLSKNQSDVSINASNNSSTTATTVSQSQATVSTNASNNNAASIEDIVQGQNTDIQNYTTNYSKTTDNVKDTSVTNTTSTSTDNSSTNSSNNTTN